MRVTSILVALLVPFARAFQCEVTCGPNPVVCGRCVLPDCTNADKPVSFSMDDGRVGVCARGFFPTSYPLCYNRTRTSETTRFSYTCTSDIHSIRDSRMLQLAAHSLRLAYSVSPPLRTCRNSCSDVGLTRFFPPSVNDSSSSFLKPLRRDELHVVCGDCVPSTSLSVGSRDVLASQPTSLAGIRAGRSAVVWGGSFSYLTLDRSLLSRRDAASLQSPVPTPVPAPSPSFLTSPLYAQSFSPSGLGVPVAPGEELAYEGRHIYVCWKGVAADTSLTDDGVLVDGVVDGKLGRGGNACLSELSARGLLDDSATCFDGVRSVTCPDGGNGHTKIEWAGRVLAMGAFVSMLVSLNWWAIPIVQTIPLAYTWADELSPLLRALYEGMDIILLKWDFTSSCPVQVDPTACELINVMIGSAIVLGAAFFAAIVSHVVSRIAASLREGDIGVPSYPPNNTGRGPESPSQYGNGAYSGPAGVNGQVPGTGSGLLARLASPSSRLSFGGAIWLWWWVSMVPVSHFTTSLIIGNTLNYGSGGWWLFGALAIPMLLIILFLCCFAIAVGAAATSRVTRETRGLAATRDAAEPVVAQTPYGQIVSAIGGYSPLYRAFVAHPLGPMSLISATSPLRNRGWSSWFPSDSAMSWGTPEGEYDGESFIVKHCGVVYNSFNPSNLLIGSVFAALCTAAAIISGIQCLYGAEKGNCTIVRSVLCFVAMGIVFLIFISRRPLLADNILPTILLFLIAIKWLLYMIFVCADTLMEIPPQVVLIVFSLAALSYGLIMGFVHAVVRFAHVVASDDAPRAITTVALNVSVPRKEEPRQAPTTVAIPTYHHDGRVLAEVTPGSNILVPAESMRVHPSTSMSGYHSPTPNMQPQMYSAPRTSQGSPRGRPMTPTQHASQMRVLQQQQAQQQAYDHEQQHYATQGVPPPMMGTALHPAASLVPSTGGSGLIEASGGGSRPTSRLPTTVNWVSMHGMDGWKEEEV